MVKFLKDISEYNAMLEASKTQLVVIDFTATWCPPCQMIGPFFEAMSTEEEFSSVIFYKVDVDDASDIASECGISVMPTFQFFKDGAKITEFSGASPEKLKSTLQSLM